MKPFYDRELRLLFAGTTEVKRFMQASDVQEIIVTVFQEEKWCSSIDDPLLVKADPIPEQRLWAAVCNLNRRQRVLHLHFRVIHKGTGVAWQFRKKRDKNHRSHGYHGYKACIAHFFVIRELCHARRDLA